MPLTLFLLRHAKSAWDKPSLKDFDRPLSGRGQREAHWLMELMRARGIRPTRVISSAARRTRETLTTLLPSLSDEIALDVTRELYEAPAERLLSIIRRQPSTDGALMLVGHNPGLEDLAKLLVGSGDTAAIAALRRKYPPAGLAQLAFEIDRWSDVTAGGGRLVAFDTPPREGD